MKEYLYILRVIDMNMNKSKKIFLKPYLHEQFSLNYIERKLNLYSKQT